MWEGTSASKGATAVKRLTNGAIDAIQVAASPLTIPLRAVWVMNPSSGKQLSFLLSRRPSLDIPALRMVKTAKQPQEKQRRAAEPRPTGINQEHSGQKKKASMDTTLIRRRP
ncbi:hypothetical protein A6R68_09557 [Neotoma lepida]|uniref:Uncharacterized protein n=1 Tax=Neotoma lepida TaxID=56216 RepID=A0A1A6FZG1_NEOLE|nr:hypothetical protein A6R68_09557 [Neotoma lepida]